MESNTIVSKRTGGWPEPKGFADYQGGGSGQMVVLEERRECIEWRGK